MDLSRLVEDDISEAIGVLQFLSLFIVANWELDGRTKKVMKTRSLMSASAGRLISSSMKYLSVKM